MNGRPAITPWECLRCGTLNNNQWCDDCDCPHDWTGVGRPRPRYCRRGHELTPDNRLVTDDGEGRGCLTCHRDRQRRYDRQRNSVEWRARKRADENTSVADWVATFTPEEALELIGGLL